VITILLGVSGSGKTTIGQALSDLTGWPFLDGDDYHPEANIAKMSRGEPLTDADRAPWLEILRTEIAARLARGEDAILACSALKKAYRQQLQVDPAQVRFVYLQVSPELLQNRLEQRKGHFMQSSMLSSQLETLEEPDSTEALTVEVKADSTPATLATTIQKNLSDNLS
jgi:carbohydrate kinase (thermoresistant glucokinase family)